MLAKLLWIGLAGGLGTLARYGLGGLVQRWAGAGFPWGTVVVNLLGCLAFGAVWGAASERLTISGELRTIILVGFMGGFTTFSSFVSETTQLMGDSEWLLAGGNMLLHNVVGIAVFLLGLALGRSV